MSTIIQNKGKQRSRGFCRKTFGSLEVNSGYSQQRVSPELSFHHLSLHTQAQETMKYHDLKDAAFAGPPLAMRESRTSVETEDSGNKHALNPHNLSHNLFDGLLRQDGSSSFTKTHNKTNRKCRSQTALLNRKVRRAYKRNMQRCLFRKVRAQAYGVASQVPVYAAQDPVHTRYPFICSATMKRMKYIIQIMIIPQLRIAPTIKMMY